MNQLVSIGKYFFLKNAEDRLESIVSCEIGVFNVLDIWKCLEFDGLPFNNETLWVAVSSHK